MSKERLEEIQKDVNYAYRRDRSINTKAVTMHIDHYEHLYEQAERVQELEELVEDYKAINKELHQRGKRVRKQNKRYRELLTSQALKQLIRLEDKGCFLPEEYHKEFLDLKYAVEALEGEINDSERINKRTREI